MPGVDPKIDVASKKVFVSEFSRPIEAHVIADISTSRVCHRNEVHAPIRSQLAVFFAAIVGNSGLGSVVL